MFQELITDKRICLVAKARPPLKKLELMGFMGRYPEIHGALKLLLQACQSTLEELTFGAWSLELEDTGIVEVLRRCPEITQLNINGLQVSNVFGRYSDDHSVLLNLKTLKVRGTEIDDNEMAMIGTRCRNLRYLDIGDCKKVTDKGVMEVVRNCQRLRDIILDDCDKVSSCTLPLILLLSRPSLRNIDPPCIDDLNKRLINLFLSFNCRVGDSSMSDDFNCLLH
ncbi:hypothetical protein RHSIM_Rhsim01G0029500 [Rhododendron simsii]|uniref:Uncharacterized protein n=1 Tax=Rhododendron simsii TaxID=118357 RepID=A0A834LV24_RHOSS|nr:hypothetical protein RHSIM_Rhsim01G0029500 [Rhododendron simsii]